MGSSPLVAVRAAEHRAFRNTPGCGEALAGWAAAILGAGVCGAQAAPAALPPKLCVHPLPQDRGTVDSGVCIRDPCHVFFLKLQQSFLG